MRTITTLLLLSLSAPAAASDEPGADRLLFADEPGITPHVTASASASAVARKNCRLELGVGLSSLVVDPDVAVGVGGGIYFAYIPSRWFGAEASFYFAGNPYTDQLGEIGSTFLAGSLSLGPVLQLTPPEGRFTATLELGLGMYFVVPTVQDPVWSLGVSFGSTFGIRIFSWLGVGVKVRYQLFNLARVAGPELIDLKSFRTVGIIDRLEVPGYVAFYF